MLLGVQIDVIRKAAVLDDRIRGDAQLAGRRQQARTLVAEAVDVGRNRARGRYAQRVRRNEIGGTRRVHVDHENHGSGLRAFKRHIETNMNLHVICSLKSTTPSGPRAGARPITPSKATLWWLCPNK